jgi:hydroxymethylpyrimidine/phosphomethylpyrimidine kinase
MSIGFAVRGARDARGVASIPVNLVEEGGRLHTAGLSGFDADARIARIILTTMKFDPAVRSAATIRYSENLVAVLEDLLLECASFDSAHEPPGISTMDWGIASCCNDDIPDIIYTRGGWGKEGFICLTGEEPIVVANNILILSNRILHSEL